jgi:ABC-type branched-subunit amino acid transport system substrate-binding protein
VRSVHAIMPLDLDGNDIKDWRAAMELALEELGGPSDGLTVKGVFANASDANGEESPERAAAAAATAVADPTALAVVGPVSSSATSAAAPVLNRAGMLEVLMSATSVSLTIRPDGLPGPPPDIAPTGKRNIVRIVPNDRVQARALVGYLQEEGIRRIEVLDDGGRFGTGLSKDILSYARTRSIPAVSHGTVNRATAAAAARRIAIENRNLPGRWALLLAVNDQALAVAATRAAAATSPSAVVSGPDALTFRAFLAGIGPLERLTYLTTFQLPLEYYGPDGDRVSRILRARLDHEPSAGSLFAYEAMALAISSIRAANAKTPLGGMALGAQRAAVTRVALATTDRASVIGTYSVGLTGDTSNTLFGAYRVEDAVLVRGRAIDTAEGS